MVLHWPQITYIVISTLGIGISIAQHGKPRSNENAFTTIIASCIAYALMYAGGFFG